MTDESDLATIAYFAGAADAKDEITRLRAELAALRAERDQVRAAFEAMHPSHAGGMTDAEFCSLWNATLALLDRETPMDAKGHAL